MGGEKGSADTERDPRGFAVKFYTEEGNYDFVGNNTPVFFIRDPLKFPDFIHTQKRNPQTNLKDADMFWDFLSLSPESLHQVTILFSDRGTPYSYRNMNGYSGHTFKLVNARGEGVWCKMHFKTETGIKNHVREEAIKLAGADPDFVTRDLFDHIAKGGEASWRCYFQIMPLEDASRYRFDILDMTKVWPHKDYPLIEFGRMVLNRNPENYFAEIEQSAFSPASVVPGIEPSPDKMLQGRLFSYYDTHRHRLGVNYTQIPVNCPYRARLGNYSERDGFMAVNGNQGAKPNYEPNSVAGTPKEDRSLVEHPHPVHGSIVRTRYTHPNTEYEQPGALYRKVMTEEDRRHLIHNLVEHMKNITRREIQERQVKLFYKCDPDYGIRIAKGLGLETNFLSRL